LSTDVDVYDYALGFRGEAGVAVGHGEGYHLLFCVLVDVCYLGLGNGGGCTSLGQVMIFGKAPAFSFCPLTMASMIEG
jgi:hypothetical protein